MKNTSVDNAFDELMQIEPSLEEITSVETAVPYEEIDYSKNDKYANTCFMYTDEIQAYPLASPEEIVEMIKRRDATVFHSPEYYEVRNQIVEANLRLVVSWSYKYTRDHMEVTDFIQNGNIGLMVAAEKFNLDKKCKFSTYASWWIRQAITRYRDMDNNMHVPVHVSDKYRKMMKFKHDFTMENYREPNLHEISEATGLSVEMICRLNNTINLDSIDRPVMEDDEGRSPLSFFLAADTNVEEEVIDKVTSTSLFSALNSFLTEREKRILVLRYGLDGNGPRTLEEVGKMIGVTRERVRQIERNSIRKLSVNPKFRRTFESRTITA